MRRDITDLLLRDFGYSRVKSEKRLKNITKDRDYDELTDEEKLQYDRQKERNEAFFDWFITSERDEIVDCLREIQKETFIANSIYPTCYEELKERRIHQDLAIGQCYRLQQELQYAIETLPVNVDLFLNFSDSIQKEISLLKSWRKSDNKFKRVISETVSAANFANVNNNGNANYNNAPTVLGVRPDFDAVVKEQ